MLSYSVLCSHLSYWQTIGNNLEVYEMQNLVVMIFMIKMHKSHLQNDGQRERERREKSSNLRLPLTNKNTIELNLVNLDNNGNYEKKKLFQFR